MLAIETRFHGPTNFRDSRVSARVMEGARPGSPIRKTTVSWDHGMDSRQNHERAALALIRKLGWTKTAGYGDWIIGDTRTGYVFVCNTLHGDYRLDQGGV